MGPNGRSRVLRSPSVLAHFFPHCKKGCDDGEFAIKDLTIDLFSSTGAKGRSWSSKSFPAKEANKVYRATLLTHA